MLRDWSRRVAALTQLRVADLDTPTLTSADEHHLRRVLRAAVGEEVVLTDGAGRWALAIVEEAGVRRVTPVERDPAPTATVLYLSPLKGDRDEWAVAKATEVGITKIVPLMSARLAVKFKGEAREKQLARWQRIALDTAGQCRRTHDVEIGAPVTPAAVPLTVAVADFGGEPSWADVTAVAIGPEGGFADDEWRPEHRRLSLGTTVLRAETAAVVAASLIVFTQGSWGFTTQAPRHE